MERSWGVLAPTDSTYLLNDLDVAPGLNEVVAYTRRTLYFLAVKILISCRLGDEGTKGSMPEANA